jgi:hypothetical protein
LSKAPVASATVGASSIAPSVLPHRAQKARLERSEDRHTAGAPASPTHSTAGAGYSTQPSVKAPECRRQISQEQV